MNAMFYVDGKLLTPALTGSILDGVTRNSLIAIAHDKHITIEERPVSIAELKAAFEAGKRVEAFGAGTAAVIAPIKAITIEGRKYDCYTGADAMMYELKNELYNLRKGITADTHNWNYIL